MDDASREAKAILDKADIEFAFIREEGIQEAEALRKAAKKGKCQEDLLCNQAKLISLEEFRARSEILGRKEEVLKGILSQIQREFFSLSGRSDYPEVLKKLIRHAISYLKGEGSMFVCRLNSGDWSLLPASIFRELGKEMKKDISLDKTSVDIVGGVIVLRNDLRVLYDNSLEAIFERNRQQMRCMAAECIFGKE